VVTRIPIVCDVLIWARKRNKLEISEAARRLKCDHDQLSKIEAGTLLPTAGLFRRMASVYLLPEATLLRDTPPLERPLPKDFRSFEGAAVTLSYETIASIRHVEGRQEAMATLAEIDKDVIPPNLPIHSLDENPEKLGANLRKQLGFSVVDQLRLTGEKAFMHWRVLVENMGVSVYVEPFGKDDTRGVSLFFNAFPAIVIDQKETFSGARLFTLFHELGHLLIRQAGISNFNGRNSVEAFCNRFAAAFLMPAEAIEAVFDLSKLKDNEPDISQLEFAAAKLCVTISQVALRLEQLGYAQSGYYKRIASKLKPPTPKPKKKDIQVPFKFTYLSSAGHNLPSTVFASLDRQQITTLEAYRLLDLAPAHFNTIRTVINARRSEAIDGHG
jgi:Zn-dependent peptidase ImmA (M78 family)/transcriptional regulator with XRE-family HTH domain